jgi:hypothetical protein
MSHDNSSPNIEKIKKALLFEDEDNKEGFYFKNTMKS